MKEETFWEEGDFQGRRRHSGKETFREKEESERRRKRDLGREVKHR